MSYPPPPPPPGGTPPYGPPPGGDPGYGAYGQQPETSKKAIWALVTGLVGLLCCGPVAIAAIILSRQAKDEIAQSQGRLSGGGMAQAGFILGIIAIVFWAIGLILNITGALTFNT